MQREASRIIEEIMVLIDEGFLRSTLDAPIARAFRTFDYDEKDCATPDYVLKTIGAFVQHVHRQGLQVPKELSVQEALIESMAILETYQSKKSSGYYIALLEAINNGIRPIIDHVTQYFIVRTRTNHIRWVFSTRLTPLDWETKCGVVEVLLHRWKPYLPQAMNRCSPAELASELEELILVLADTENTIRRLLEGDRGANMV